MNQLEAQNVSTAAIRQRRRDAFRMPDMLACCGVGLAFGGNDNEYVLQKQARAEREEHMRAQYNRHKQQQQPAHPVDEAFEVVE